MFLYGMSSLLFQVSLFLLVLSCFRFVLSIATVIHYHTMKWKQTVFRILATYSISVMVLFPLNYVTSSIFTLAIAEQEPNVELLASDTGN